MKGAFRIGDHVFDTLLWDADADVLGLAKSPRRDIARSGHQAGPEGHYLGYSGGELVVVELVGPRQLLERDAALPVHDENGQLLGDAGPAMRDILGA